MCQSQPVGSGRRGEVAERTHDTMARTLFGPDGLDEDMVDVDLVADTLLSALDEHRA
jgi:hypothetical protein